MHHVIRLWLNYVHSREHIHHKEEEHAIECEFCGRKEIMYLITILFNIIMLLLLSFFFNSLFIHQNIRALENYGRMIILSLLMGGIWSAFEMVRFSFYSGWNVKTEITMLLMCCRCSYDVVNLINGSTHRLVITIIIVTIWSNILIKLRLSWMHII